MSNKALVIPYRDGQVLIQDRSNIKKIPYLPWGYFGGGIEERETPIEAAIREIKEELDLTILPEDLVTLGKFSNPQDLNPNIRHVFLIEFKKMVGEMKILEGKAAKWVLVHELIEYLESATDIDIAQATKQFLLE